MPIARRAFLRNSGIGLIACNVGGALTLLTPAEARARALPFKIFDDQEVKTLERLYETLLPGAVSAGVVHFVDDQLSNPRREMKLSVRYLNTVLPPYEEFYRQGLAAVQAMAQKLFERPIRELEPDQLRELVQRLVEAKTPEWNGADPRQFYHSLKSDAVDVVFGTPEGIESLGMPYMPHIRPPEKW